MQTTRSRFAGLLTIFLALALTGCALFQRGSGNSPAPYLGEWMVLPAKGGAGWLNVFTNESGLHAELLWRAGSVNAVDSAQAVSNRLILRINRPITRTAPSGPITITNTQFITITRYGQLLQGVSVTPKFEAGDTVEAFSAYRAPAMPPAPDLSQIRFGDQIKLFNGRDLTGWHAVESNAPNTWRAENGLLIRPGDSATRAQGESKAVNLATDELFKDFQLHAEVRLPFTNANSGIYLRGLYEVQVYDTYGKPLDSHNMGAIYSRITPTAAAEKPVGEWQTLDITLVDRHVTVVLNGTKIIDNKPIAGPTGGALSTEVTQPGPIMLQGDHTGIEYRNLWLRPAINDFVSK